MGGDSRLGTWVFGARKLQVSRGAATNFVVNFIASFVETLRTESTKFTTKGLGSWRGLNLVASIIANFVGLSWTKRPS